MEFIGHLYQCGRYFTVDPDTFKGVVYNVLAKKFNMFLSKVCGTH